MQPNDWPINEDAKFQKHTWQAERVGWAVFALIPLLALTGLFTHGYLSDTQARDGHALMVAYERFQHITRLTHFTFHIAHGAPGELRLSAPFQRIYTVETIHPRPTRSTADPDGLRLSFEKPEGQALIVDVWARPQKWGWFELNAQTRETAVTFNILVYP